jgi:hypothetical protein
MGGVLNYPSFSDGYTRIYGSPKSYDGARTRHRL